MTKDSLFHTNSKNSDSSIAANLLIKTDSSGTPREAYTWANDTSFLNLPSIAADKNGHIYVAFMSGSNIDFSFISQFNTSGTINWTDTMFNKELYSSGPFSEVVSIATGNSNNLLVLGVIDSNANFPLDTSVNCSSYALFTAMINNEDTTSGISPIHPPQNTLSLYPNPATQNITLKYTATIPSVYNCTITDITGRIVQNSQIQAVAGINISQVDMQSLSAGMYIVSLQNGNEVFRAKVMKE